MTLPSFIHPFRWMAGAVLLAALAFPALARPQEGNGSQGQFPENGLERTVDFWESVFTRYRHNQVLIHDKDDVYVVYEVVEVEGDDLHDAAARARQHAVIASRTAHWEEVLRSIARALEGGGKPSADLKGEITRIERLLGRALDAARARELAGNIHVQRGILELFTGGLARSGKYLPHMKTIFHEMGVPEEILALPLFESSFQEESRSSKGAAGVWQFIRPTGKVFLRIDRCLDERLDPLLATRGAARYLLDAYRKLGSWPLSVMAYNHGTNGIARARDQYGTDHMKVISHYTGRQFGYASRNYYPEFLAALRVLRNPARYFPRLEITRPWAFREKVLDRTMTQAQIQKTFGMDAETLREYNPAIFSTHRLQLPAGFRLKYPPDRQARIEAEKAAVRVAEEVRPTPAVRTPQPTPAAQEPRRAPAQAGESDARGRTVHRLGGKKQAPHSAPVAGRGNDSRQEETGSGPEAGDDKGDPAAAQAPEAQKREAGTSGETWHVVQMGETLFSIAKRYGVSVADIQKWNRVRGTHIEAGQKLRITR